MQDSLLYQKFFSSFGSETELKEAIQRENLEISQLIKQVLYPQADENAVYYTGRHNHPADLKRFTQGGYYIALQRQFDRVIAKLKEWGVNHNNVYTLDSLDAFAVKLKNPSDRITILYGDGKKSLEIIAVLLEEATIDLDLRKALFTNLLADNELAKCIDGCYTRISNTAKILLENRESANQINRWIRSYATDTARKLAARRPFAMPESYQRLICRTLEISVEANELHVSNYLLSQAKEQGIPVELTSDLAALEIAHKVTALDKRVIVDLYLKQLESEISAARLVTFIGLRLHNSLTAIMSDTSKEYMDKISMIEAKLNLLGRDKAFLLEEIMHIDSLTLKPNDNLMITILRRLIDKRWLNEVEVANIVVLQKSFSYYHFPNNVELSWLVEEGDIIRFRFIDLLKSGLDDQLSDSINNGQLLKTILHTEKFCFTVKDIDILLKYNTLPIASLLPLDRIKTLLNDNPDPFLFKKLLKVMSTVDSKAMLDTLTKPTIDKIISKGIELARVETRFDGLKSAYFIEKYDFTAKKEALKITKHLWNRLIRKEYHDFSGLRFLSIKHTDYFNDINFSNCDLRNSIIFQAVSNCQFDNSLLTDTVFSKKLQKISFVGTDLRNTFFRWNVF